MLSVKQFFFFFFFKSLVWVNLGWNPVSWTIGELSKCNLTPVSWQQQVALTNCHWSQDTLDLIHTASWNVSRPCGQEFTSFCHPVWQLINKMDTTILLWSIGKVANPIQQLIKQLVWITKLSWGKRLVGLFSGMSTSFWIILWSLLNNYGST